LKTSAASFWCLLLLAFSAAQVPAADIHAPHTAIRPVTDHYGDLIVTDPYRWLENASDPKVRQWSLAQDRYTRRYIDGLAVRAPLFAHLVKQFSTDSSAFYDLQVAGGRVFARFNQPPKQQPMIAMLGPDADAATARVVVDPNQIDPAGTTAFDWYVPSPDGKRVAVSLSKNGSEEGTLHVYDVATGREIGSAIPRVQYPTGGGSVAWRADGSGFWYTRYPGPHEAAQRQRFYQQIYFHKLGDAPSADRYVLGKTFPKVAEITLTNRQNSKQVIASVANGDGGEFAHYLLGQDGSVRQVSRFEDKIVSATVGPDGFLYLVSRKDAPHGKLLRLSLDDLNLVHATVLLPESDAVIQAGGEFGGTPVVITSKAIYVREQTGGPGRVAILDHDGKPQGLLPLPDLAAVDEVVPLGDGTLLYSVLTYLQPHRFARYHEARAASTPSTLVRNSPISYADTEVLREFATSKDGTKIPLIIVRRKDTRLDGNNPVLLNGYGAYGVSMEPVFQGPETRVWLDAGGVYVIANLRGGGEFGETWHLEGALTSKQNVFDDFAAVAQYLIAQKYTTSDRMAAMGGSNGGLLMGAVVTQHPALFRAVVSEVGIYDMLRVERDPNGAFNITEFGSTQDRAQRDALYAYSPYHHVENGVRYPAIYMATGETDGRVNPMHSRKMVARLQAVSAGRPVYLSINSNAGHGIGSALSTRISQIADIYSFLFDQLGMTP
jgi:prolyl oligopeptidase